MTERGEREGNRNLSFGSFIVFLRVIISIKNMGDNDHSHYFHSSVALLCLLSFSLSGCQSVGKYLLDYPSLNIDY